MLTNERTAGRSDKRTENRIPISRHAKAGATKISKMMLLVSASLYELR